MMTAMNKSPNSSPFNPMNTDEDWTSHPAIDWLLAHKSIFLWVFFGLIALLILSSRLIAWRTLDAEKDFFQAQTAFARFEQDATLAETTNASTDLEQLEAIMQRHPELKPKYEGSLAQILLVTGKIPQAKIFINDIFKRTEPDHLKLYQDYTEASLLIGLGNYADALISAKQLKENLDSQGSDTNSVLYGFNLVRLALLYQQAGKSQEELKIWEDLQNQSQTIKGLLTVAQAFQIGNASLSQYAEARKNNLVH